MIDKLILFVNYVRNANYENLVCHVSIFFSYFDYNKLTKIKSNTFVGISGCSTLYVSFVQLHFLRFHPY